MAIVWQGNGNRQYCSILESQREDYRDLAIRAGYLFLQQLDLILTLLATSSGFNELNPLMRNLLGLPVQLMVVKVVIPFFIVWLVPGKYLLPAFILLSLVVSWNIKELLFVLF